MSIGTQAALAAVLVVAVASPVAAQGDSDGDVYEAFFELGAQGIVSATLRAVAQDKSAESVVNARALVSDHLAELDALDVRPCFEDAYTFYRNAIWLTDVSLERLADLDLENSISLSGAAAVLLRLGAPLVAEARDACGA